MFVPKLVEHGEVEFANRDRTRLAELKTRRRTYSAPAERARHYCQIHVAATPGTLLTNAQIMRLITPICNGPEVTYFYTGKR
jgi:hypothetical protein